MTDSHSERLASIAQESRTALGKSFSAREKALRLSREAIQHSANSIRAVHRNEMDLAKGLLESAGEALRQVSEALEQHPNVYYAGFVEDAQKEYAEANSTLAFVAGRPLPGPTDLGMGHAAYLNGLAEAVGELRRYLLDSLRRDDVSRCEELLAVMDEVYTILVTMDFPDAITRGLRRTTDSVRGILERTRGDLTMALRQRSLERRIAAFESQQK
jgi:translin